MGLLLLKIIIQLFYYKNFKRADFAIQNYINEKEKIKNEENLQQIENGENYENDEIVISEYLPENQEENII